MKLALNEAADIILKISQRATKSVAVKVLIFLKAPCFPSSEYCHELSSSKPCFKLSESNTREKLAGLEMKPSTFRSTTENSTEGKNMFFLIDAGELIMKQLCLPDGTTILSDLLVKTWKVEEWPPHHLFFTSCNPSMQITFTYRFEKMCYVQQTLTHVEVLTIAIKIQVLLEWHNFIAI